jgi:ribosomal protein L11 methyltransferase
MTWLRMQVDVAAARVEPLETALTAVGAVAIQLAAADDEAILEPAPDATPLWERVRLTALFEPTTDDTRIRLVVAGMTEPGALPPIRFDVVEDEDWVTKLREELVPLRFGANLWVCPPGKTCPDPRGTVIMMEPGLAFGPGAHTTTRLCMDWLAPHPPVGRTMLDYGCGSGILGIAGLGLGATQVTAVDIDAQALAATRENARRNAGGGRLRVVAADELDDAAPFDIIVANILSATLIELAPTLHRHSRAGTLIALSGILTEQAAPVLDAYRGWTRFDGPINRDGWALLAGKVI